MRRAGQLEEAGRNEGVAITGGEGAALSVGIYAGL
jgi:hypothetical protein